MTKGSDSCHPVMFAGITFVRIGFAGRKDCAAISDRYGLPDPLCAALVTFVGKIVED